MKQQMNEQARQRVNKPSTLLSHDENELLFSLLGRKCQVSRENALNLVLIKHLWIGRLLNFDVRIISDDVFLLFSFHFRLDNEHSRCATFCDRSTSAFVVAETS